MTDIGIKIGAVDNTKSAFDSIGRSLNSLQGASAGVASSLAGLGAAVTVGAFVSFAKQVIDGVDALNDLKDATGASIENISALEDVARRSGTSLDTVGSALIKLNQALNNAKPGSDTEKALNAIGMSVKDLKSLDPADAFQKIAVSLNGFADDANKARLTQELFGKSLKEVAPLLKDVADAGGLVATVTTEQAQAAETFNKQLFALQKNVTDVSRSLVSEFVPSLVVIAEEFSKSAASGNGFASAMGGGIKTVLETSAVLVANVAFVLRSMGREIGAITAQMAALARADIDGFNAISEAVKQDGVIARKELDDFEKRLLGLGAQTSVLLADESAAETARLRRRPSAVIKDGPDKAAIAAANAELKAQAKLIAELAGLTGSFSEDWVRLNTLYKAGKFNTDQLTEAQAALLAKQPAIKAETDALAAAQKAANKAMEDAGKAADKYNESFGKSADTVEKQVQALLDEETALKTAATQNISLAAAIEQVIIKRLEEAAVLERKDGNYSGAEQIEREIEQRKKLSSLIDSKNASEAANKATQKLDEENARSAERLQTSITDALMRGFEDGKPFAQNFADTVENTFKSMVLRPMVSAVVSPISQGVSSAVSSAGNSMMSSLFGQGATASSVGKEMGAGFSSTVSGWFGQGGSAIAADGGMAAGASADAYAAAAASGGSQSAAATLGSTMPYLLAFAAAVTMLKGGDTVQSKGYSDNSYDPNGVGSALGTRYGAYSETVYGRDSQSVVNYPAGLTPIDYGNGFNPQNMFESPEAKAFVDGLSKTYLEATKTLGAIAQGTHFGFSANDTGKGTVLGGTATGTLFNSGEIDLKNDAATKLAASRAVFAALQDSEMPAYLARVFDAVVPKDATQAAMDEAIGFATALKTTRDALLETRTPLDILQDTVASGFADLGTNATDWKKDFVAAIDAGLTPETFAQWNALGANVTALGEAAGTASRSVADIANSLAGLQKTGAQLAIDLQAVADPTGARAAQRTLDTAKLTAPEIAQYDANASTKAQIETAKTLASWAERNAALLASATPVLQRAYDLQKDLTGVTDLGVQTQIKAYYAQLDLNDATAAKTAAAKDAAAALTSSLTSSFQTTKDQYDVLVGNRTQAEVDRYNTLGDVYTAEQETLYNVTLIMKDRIAQEQQFAEAAKAAAAASAAIDERLAGTASSLNIELLKAQGNIAGATAATRALAIEGMSPLQVAAYDANASVQTLIDGYARAKAVASERAGLETELLQLQGNTTELRARELAALDPSNRALKQATYAYQDARAAQDKYTQSVKDANAAIATAQNAIATAQNAVTTARNAVQSVQAEGTNAYLSALGAVAAAQVKVSDVQLSAQAELARAANETAQAMQDLGKQLREFVDGAALKPSDNFARVLTAALGGDKAAMQALPGAATEALDARKLVTTNLDFAREQAKIYSQVASVATLAELAGKQTVAGPAATDPLAKANADLATAQTALGEALRVATAINAPLSASVADLIAKYATAQSDLTKATTDLADAKAVLANIEKNTFDTNDSVKNIKLEVLIGDLTKTVKFVTDSSLSPALQRVVIDQTGDYKAVLTAAFATTVPETLQNVLSSGVGEYDATIKATAASTLTDAQKRVIFDGQGDYISTIGAVMSSTLTAPQKEILLNANTTATRAVTLGALFATTLGDAEKAALTAQSGNIYKNINTSLTTGTITDAQLTVLTATNDPVRKTITALMNDASLTTSQKSFLNAINATVGTNTTLTLGGTVGFDPGNALQSVFDNISKANTLLQMGLLYTMNILSGVSWQVNAAGNAIERVDPKAAASTYGLLTVMRDMAKAQKVPGYFADGGVFTNSIVSSATPFNFGVMGEAGPEAIMPLHRGPDGSLGVKALMPNFARFGAESGNTALVNELRKVTQELQRLQAEVSELRRSNTHENTVIAAHGANTADSVRRMDSSGVLVYTDAAEPLKTVAA